MIMITDNVGDINSISAAFKPYASMQKAHHMLLFGCDEPGSDQKIW